MVHSRRVMVARDRPRTSSSLAKLSMSARRTANSGRERVRHQVMNWRRSSAYASRVRPRYPARNPARASRSGSVKAGWIVASAVDGAGSGHRAPPGRAETREAGPAARSQRMKRRTHRRRAQPVTPCHNPPGSGRYRPPRNTLQTAESACLTSGLDSVRVARRSSGSALAD
jgi:hypothetical protein